jgi:hypothetical protein
MIISSEERQRNQQTFVLASDTKFNGNLFSSAITKTCRYADTTIHHELIFYAAHI